MPRYRVLQARKRSVVYRDGKTVARESISYLPHGGTYVDIGRRKITQKISVPGDHRGDGNDVIAVEQFRQPSRCNYRVVIKLHWRKLDKLVRQLHDICTANSWQMFPTLEEYEFKYSGGDRVDFVIHCDQTGVDFLSQQTWVREVTQTQIQLPSQSSRGIGRKPKPKINREFVRNGRYVYGVGPIHTRNRV